MAGLAAIFDVPMPLAIDLGDCGWAFATGRRLTMPFCLSGFITAAPCCGGVAEGLCEE